MAKLQGVTVAHMPMYGRLVTATYHGGPYIDLSFGSTAFEVINVWDYEADKPRIENTHRAVREAMREWKRAAGSSLRTDLQNYAESIGER